MRQSQISSRLDSIIKNEDGEELLDPFEMDWYKELSAEITPASNIRFYRRLCNMTQAQLAEKLGVVKQDVSGMERGKRPISKATARKLARIFQVGVWKFI